MHWYSRMIMHHSYQGGRECVIHGYHFCPQIIRCRSEPAYSRIFLTKKLSESPQFEILNISGTQSIQALGGRTLELQLFDLPPWVFLI